MRVLITGGTGLIGQGVKKQLQAEGAEVLILSRKPAVNGESIQWDPDAGRIDRSSLEGFNAIVHLAGESIGAGRWTAARKARILKSRVGSTRLLAETIARLESPPQVVVSSSAIGYYGDRGDELLTEQSAAGVGFLTDVCVAWEDAIRPVVERGIRTVIPRIGVVLTPDGGALQQMLPLYKFGLGGKLGSGAQYWSWIAYSDVVKGMTFALRTTSLNGPVNLVAPKPVTNGEFNAKLASILHRPAFFAAPRFALRLVLGEMADALLLSSMRVSPSKLFKAGYQFEHAELDDALRAVLSR